MADKDDFFFKVYAKETLLKKKLREIPLEAQAIVFRMWCVCCLEGSISADPEEIAQACCLKFSEVDLVRTHMHSLMRFFYVAHDASLHSAFMEEERGKVTGRSAQCRDAANIRWGNKTDADAYANVDAKRNAKVMPHSHSHSKKKNQTPPQPANSEEITLQIFQAHPGNSHLGERIDNLQLQAIMDAILSDGEEKVLNGTKGFAEKMRGLESERERKMTPGYQSPEKFWVKREYLKPEYQPAAPKKETLGELDKILIRRNGIQVEGREMADIRRDINIVKRKMQAENAVN